MQALMRIETSTPRTGAFRLPQKKSVAYSRGNYTPSRYDYIKSFYSTLNKWEQETAVLSDPEKIKKHPSFQSLVQNAEMTLPLIISELKKEPSFLVWVMQDAFGWLPSAPKTPGNLQDIAKDWIYWGINRGAHE